MLLPVYTPQCRSSITGISLAHAAKLLLWHQKEHEGADRAPSNLVLMTVKVVAIRKAETFECY